MKSSSPTLIDVARLAGVGVGTASRGVNGGINVSARAQTKIDAAVLELGYQPNHAARMLKGGRTRTIGLMVPSIADPFFARCAEAAETVARAHDTLLIFAVSDGDTTLEMKNLSVLMRHRPDGLLLVPANGQSRRLRQLVQESGIPIVTFDRPLPHCSSVLTDSFEAARAATLHLVGHGYRDILCLGTHPELYTIRERLNGYHQAMKEAHLTPRVDLTMDLEGASAGDVLRTQMAGRVPPDAIFALKNRVTIATFQALQRLKLSIPEDIALLGFDDFEMANTLRPSISVVRQPIEEIGSTAAGLLFARIEGRADGLIASNSKPLVLASRLILRRSCGCQDEQEAPPYFLEQSKDG